MIQADVLNGELDMPTTVALGFVVLYGMEKTRRAWRILQNITHYLLCYCILINVLIASLGKRDIEKEIGTLQQDVRCIEGPRASCTNVDSGFHMLTICRQQV